MKQPLFVAYTGPSMNPTLVEPAMLEIARYAAPDALGVGDVIFFQPPGEARAIVHRVVRATPAGIITRGDNNSCDDAWRTQFADITGRVIAVQRGNHRRIIHGRRLGIAWHYFLRAWRVVNRVVSRVLHAPYHALTRSGIARALLPVRWRPRVVTFQETRLLLSGSRVIGRYNARRGRWIIERPFRLFVDESDL